MARFEIIYAPEVVNHLACIERRFYRLIRETIMQQLQHTPLARTKNRKPLALPAPFGATWEIRCGPDNSTVLNICRRKHIQSYHAVSDTSVGDVRGELASDFLPSTDKESHCRDNRFRVFYEVRQAEREAHVLAIGVKEKNRLVVGQEEIEL